MEITGILNFNEEQQEIISNIARQSFLRGKIDALYGLEEHFLVFEQRFVSKDDLIKAIQHARLVLQEGLK